MNSLFRMLSLLLLQSLQSLLIVIRCLLGRILQIVLI